MQSNTYSEIRAAFFCRFLALGLYPDFSKEAKKVNECIALHPRVTGNWVMGGTLEMEGYSE